MNEFILLLLRERSARARKSISRHFHNRIRRLLLMWPGNEYECAQWEHAPVTVILTRIRYAPDANAAPGATCWP